MKKARCTILLLTVLALSGVAVARWATPVYAPVDRMIQNAQAYVTDHPTDASGYYTLARIHYLAFVDKAFLVGTFSQGVPPSIIPASWMENYLNEARRAEAISRTLKEFGLDSTDQLTNANRSAFWDRESTIENQLKAQNWQPEKPTTEELVNHAGAAQWNFYRAAALDPNNALYNLGLASLGEQYLDFFKDSSPALMPAPLKSIALTAVKATYLSAYDLSIQKDLQLSYLPLQGLHSIIGYEAGSAYVRLWEAEKDIPADVQTQLASIKANLATWSALPIGAITPIIFSLQPSSSLAELLAPSRVVHFDLDGDGRSELRPWVQPTTGFLVWDGDHDGRITSGREMFGSVTWWLFFKDGYRAMDLLDDNRDGWLSGRELEGLAVWFDRNSNGVSDAGEVVSLESLGIEAMATHANGTDGKALKHVAGLRLKNGQTVPTYDWIAPTVESAKKGMRLSETR